MFKFFSLLFLKLCDNTGSVDLKALYQHLPSSVKQARKVQSGDNISFSKLIVCQKCSSTYRYDECLENNGISKCIFVCFPRHPQKRLRMTCDFPLLKYVKTASGKHISRPLKVFCYQSIIQSVMADIYDGSVWKSFLTR